MNKKSKKETPSAKIGDFVRIGRGHGEYTNRIGIYIRDDYDGDRIIAFADEDYTYLKEGERVNVVKATYVVTWATTDYDPAEYCETLVEAEKLAAKLARKRDVVNVRIWKLNKSIK